ncbi:MAG: isochorismatase family hydrolase [Candidatus Binataceae bacterium]
MKVGLAVSEGTGPELAEVFQQVIANFAQLYSVDVTVQRSPRLYHTYHSIIADNQLERVARLTNDDASHYETYCRELAGAGVPAVFRTAMNAQSLYLVRQRLQAVKVERLSADALDLLLIRDQAQGFYTGHNEHRVEDGVVSRSCDFSKQLTAAIVAFAIRQSREIWNDGRIDRIIMAYKFHLLDGLFSSWVREWSAEHSIDIEIFQPDTVNRNLITNGLQGRVLIIGANEWADIMHVILLRLLGLGPQENRYTRNVYLHPDLNGLMEYQTVHGSADDLAGKRLVNPFATSRAAAAIMERHAGCNGAEVAMERAVGRALERGIATPDLSGAHSTHSVVEALLDDLGAIATERPVALNHVPAIPNVSKSDVSLRAAGEGTALIVMDLQNDFCSTEGHGVEHRGDTSRLKTPTDNAAKVIEFARETGLEVIFVQFIGDEKYQKQNWKDRDLKLRKQPKCREDSWGADFYKMSPVAGERVFQKYVHFDAFLSPDFESYLKERTYEHLIFVGVFSDVCVDTTARTAFQKGYYITVVSDCTTSLHHDSEATLDYMRKVYGARIITHTELMALRAPRVSAEVRV